MSYWVEFKVVWGRGRFNPRVEEALNQVLACVEDYVRAEGTYEVERPRGWGDEFRRAFQGEETGIKLLDEAWAIGLLTHVSARFPGVPFRARGRGEERRDAWAFRCRDGQVIAERSREGERAGVVREVVPASAWPRPLAVSRVVKEAGSCTFIAEILAGQPPTSDVAALTIKPMARGKPRALVYVGPLEQEGFESIRDLIDNRYRVQQFRGVKSLARHPSATADDPQGY